YTCPGYNSCDASCNGTCVTCNGSCDASACYGSCYASCNWTDCYYECGGGTDGFRRCLEPVQPV
ncbi:MAG TPA: hypothetical protein VFQ45_12150, partial [Longimicrobium sp.]|nr:hypothetical protein [Longimicrobium sp.]